MIYFFPKEYYDILMSVSICEY